MRRAYYTLIVWSVVAMINGFGTDYWGWPTSTTLVLRVIGFVLVTGIIVGEVICVRRGRTRG
jgi:hypothetical protein